MNMVESARQSKKASIGLSACDSNMKNKALLEIARELEQRTKEIIQVNEQDLKRSEKDKLPSPLLKRLKFDENKINGVIEGIMSLINLKDPAAETIDTTILADGLELYKVACPIGVIGVIFESRPDALVQISTLCLKSGNAVLLKGGNEARGTNKILAEIISKATERVGIPAGWIQLMETRDDVQEMLKCDEYIDLIIPRGSNEFVRYIMENSNIPVLGHADGICHCYVDEVVDIDMAIRVVVDSKTQYVAVCNATETLLVNEKISHKFLPLLKVEMDKKEVELVGCEKVQKIIDVGIATEDDWKSEYLDYKLAIKIVDDLDEAIAHINEYGSGHTEAILTNIKDNVQTFMNLVDAGNVFWNCSTRFSDGFRYGFGAEVGISTNKIHARGPVGLEGLVIYKYKMVGHGQTVEDFENGTKKYKHEKINKDFTLE